MKPINPNVYLNDLKKAVDSFNEKLSNTDSKDVLNSIDFEMEKAALSYYGAPEYRSRIHQLNRFLKPGAEKIIDVNKNLRVSEYQLKELERNVALINKRREYRRAFWGEHAWTDPGDSLKDISYDLKRMNQKEFNTFFDKTNRMIRYERPQVIFKKFKENYLLAVKNYLGNDILYKKIQRMSATKLYAMSVNNPKMKVVFIYEEDEREIKADEIIQELDKVKDFKGDPRQWVDALPY